MTFQIRDEKGRFVKGHEPLSDKGRFKKGHKLSDEAKEKLRLSRLGNKSTLGRRGSNANHWKGGLTKKYKLLRGRIEWKLWREKVFLRDDYTCQKCGKSKCELHPHHIIPVKDLWNKNEDLIFDVNNGITLCKECHRKVHRKRGY